MRLLLAVTRVSARSFRGLTGADRAALYLTACGTGFRVRALAGLTPTDFDLAADVPAVILPARLAKNKKTKVQPLAADVAEALREYLADRPAGCPVWAGAWNVDAAEMLRADLAEAGIAYIIEGPDGPLFADFHALRHTYLTLGGRAGIDLRTLQELAGHSNPNLTARYSHRRLHDLAGAVEKLPSLLPGRENESEATALRATGTEGPTAPVQLPASCSPVAQTVASRCEGLRLAEAIMVEDERQRDDATPSSCKELRSSESDCEGMRVVSRLGLEPRTYGLTCMNLDPPRSTKTPEIYVFYAIPARLQGLANVMLRKRGSAEIPQKTRGRESLRGSCAED